MSGYEDLRGLVTFRPLERPLPRLGSRVAPFKASWSSTVSLLADELRHHGARYAVCELDLREQDLRLDGMPRADARLTSPGIVLSFQASAVSGQPQLRYEVATFTHFSDNIRAVALALRALRAVDRYGVTKRGEQYAGWKQLEAGGVSVDRGREIIREHGGVREALMATHPDHGGDAEDFGHVRAAQEAGAAS